MELLLEIGTDEFWKLVTLPWLESVRTRLRTLVKFADKEPGRNRVFVNFEDSIGESVHIVLTSADPSLHQYREKVRHYLRDQLDHPSVRKVRENLPLSRQDVQDIEMMLFGDHVIDASKLDLVVGDEGPLSVFVPRRWD